jgi:hypothetical protein
VQLVKLEHATYYLNARSLEQMSYAQCAPGHFAEQTPDTRERRKTVARTLVMEQAQVQVRARLHRMPQTVACEAVLEAPIEESRLAMWFWGAALSVAIWSVSYLLRQPGIATSVLNVPFSPLGNFALEGMLLALAWLVTFAAAALAVLTGVARIEDPSAR